MAKRSLISTVSCCIRTIPTLGGVFVIRDSCERSRSESQDIQDGTFVE